jgi:zinc protease
MDRVITGINASTVRSLEQVNGKASVLAEGELYAGDPLFIEQSLEWINTATAADVRDVARRYLGDGWHEVDVLPSEPYSNAATGVDRSGGLPALPTEMPTLRFPEIHTTTLDNGIEVVLAERHAVPIVALSAEFDAGYAADAGGKLGVASFAMSMLDRGTTSRGLLEIAAEAERLGANISAGSALDSSSVSLNALAAELPGSVELWADVVRNPAFEQAEIDRLRQNWIARIAQEKAEPVDLALRLLPPALYGAGHAYAVPFTGSGTEESIRSVVRDDLLAFQREWLRPDKLTVFVAGDTTLDEIVPLLESAFSGWSTPDTPPPQKNVSAVTPPSSPRVVLIDKPGSPQSLILAGHVAPGLGTDRDLVIQAMNGVLGGNFTARVNMNLREDKGWSYGAQTLLMDARGQRPFLVYAPVQTDRTGDSLNELVRELDAIRGSEPIRPAEMARVVAGSMRELPGQFQTVNAVLDSLTTSARYGRPLDYAATLTERLEALQLPELQAAAEEVVMPQSLIWLVVGDLAEIREQVEATGIGPIEVWNDAGERLE